MIVTKVTEFIYLSLYNDKHSPNYTTMENL